MKSKFNQLDKHIKIFLGVLVANAIIVLVLFQFTPPDYRGQFVTEGKAMQMLQVYLYLIGTIIGLTIFIKKKLWRHRPGYLGIPVLALVCVMEELSWGYHIFSLYEPTWFMGVRIDSLHDFVQIGTIILGNIASTPLGAVVVVAGVLLGVGAILYAIFKYRAKISPVVWMIIAFVLCIISSSIFDFNEPSTLITDLFEELSDESAAIALLFANSLLWYVKPPAGESATADDSATEEASE